jgi:hypothetical protein
MRMIYGRLDQQHIWPTTGARRAQCKENLLGVVAPPPGKTSVVAALYVVESPYGDDVMFCNLLSLTPNMQV